MRFAIISDVHGNYEALKVVAEDLEKQKIDRIIWCGDYITDMPKGREVLDIIRELNSKYKNYIIKGNREDYIIDYVEKGFGLDMDNTNIIETYKSITKDQYEFIKSLPNEVIIDELEGFEIYVSHRNDKKEIDNKYKIQISGHTHISKIEKKEDILFINPGSSGIAVGFIGSEYGILEIDENMNVKAEIIKLQYDMSKVINEIEKSKIYDVGVKWGKVLIKTLETGKPYNEMYIKKVSEMYGSDRKNISAENWEMARKSLGID